MSARTLITIVTHNSGGHLRHCLESLKTQTYRDLEVRLWDNGSQDASLDIADGYGDLIQTLHVSSRNAGFCAGHNRMIEASPADYVLVLNPDVILEPCFIEILVRALEADPGAGSATGKLWRRPEASAPAFQGQERRIIDTTGMYFTLNQRHLDRGAGEVDAGQFQAREYVFGASGAAAFYRRSMLEDVRAGGEYFDESFFAYREDADLAWRAQWMGWRCLYVPEATGFHARRVLPERRASLPADINMHSFKNRFLLRLKNMDAGTYARHFIPITVRDLLALGYVLLCEQSSLGAVPLLLKALPRAWSLRKALKRHRRTSPQELRSWFSNHPVSRRLF
jgi:GT2 family glycosyltransferase